MTILAWALIGAGGGLSVLLLFAEYRRRGATEPYAGSGRWAPEFHAVLALLTGLGSWIAWGVWPGPAVFAGHAILGVALAHGGSRDS